MPFFPFALLGQSVRQTTPPRLTMTRPDISGDRVVFSSEGDLWLGDVRTMAARRLTSDPGNESAARFSPDGQWIAFAASYDGAPNVYVMPVEGGEPKRLTYDPSGAFPEGWTPDGSAVLFVSGRRTAVGWGENLYTVPVRGGLATPMPIPRGEQGEIGPDGTLAYVPISNDWQAFFRYRAGAAPAIWTYEPKTKAFRKLTSEATSDVSPVWCGKAIYMVSERSGNYNLYRLDPKTGATKAATTYMDEPVRSPGADDKHVVFEHGQGLAMYDPATGKTTELAFAMGSERIATRARRAPLEPNLREYAMGPSGNRILVQARGQLLTIPVKSGDVRVIERADGARAINPMWSPDGKRIAFVSDRPGENGKSEYEVWTVPTDGSTPATQLTKGFGRFALASAWSPDGKNLAIADRTGHLSIVEVATGAVTSVYDDAVDTYDGQGRDFEWSPDGKAIAYAKLTSGNFQSGVFLYELATKRTVPVSAERVSGAMPHFDPKGRYLVYTSVANLDFHDDPFTGRSDAGSAMRLNVVLLSPETSSPFLPTIDEEGAGTPPKKDEKVPPMSLDGLADRTIQVPAGPSDAVIGIPVDGRLLILRRTNADPMGTLSAFDMDKREETPLASGVVDLQPTMDRKKLLVMRPGGAQVVDAGTGPFGPGQGAVSLAGATVEYDPRAEWKQTFGEAWRATRDFFYAPNMHGVDWDAVRAKYEPQVARVGSQSDLVRILRNMGSELSVGHYYVSPSGPRSGSRERMGFLGAEFDAATIGGKDALRVARILRSDAFDLDARSPLATPGVNVKKGDLILAVNGQSVRREEDPQKLLLGTAGTVVSLRVANADGTGERTVRVRPLASEQVLRYNDWVEGRKAYVAENGGPNIGYAHISDMSTNGLKGWYKTQAGNWDKDATIIDERFNGGGYISTLLLSNIASKPQAWFNMRATSTSWARESWGLMGHKVLVCNEDCYSDGEFVVEVWKKMGLGPVVGKRTGGGEVGSGGGYALLADITLNVPNYGAFDEKGWIIEGHGAEPTVEVDQDPAAVMAGRDPQLDKAIALMKEAIAKNPIYHPKTPPFKVVPGGIQKKPAKKG